MPAVLARLRRAFKAAISAAAGIRFSGSLAPFGNWHQQRDARRLGHDGSGSSLVMACILWLCRTFPEAPVRVSDVDAQGKRTPLPDHDLSKLLNRPNPFYSGVLLWFGTLLDWVVTGNAYWIKVRSAGGRVVQLWWVPAWTMQPHWPDDGSAYLDYYEYRPDMGATVVKYDPADIVHFRYGLDPRNVRKGLSPLASVLREIFTDEEAAAFSAALLHNLGVPGVVLSPDGDFHIPKEDANAAKADFDERFGGEHRGSTMVMAMPMKVSVLSFNPDQMKLTDLRRIPEERVTAILGIPAIVIGLGAGLARSTFANYAEAREAAFENNIIPTQRLFAEELNTQLMVDFARPNRTLEIDFDLSQVRILQPDQDALHARVRGDLTAGLLTLNQALQALDMEEAPSGGDVYYVPNVVTVTPAAEVLNPPAPQPVPPALAQATGQAQNGHMPTEPLPPADKQLPVKGGKAVERVIPKGAGEPLEPLPAVSYDEAERKRLTRLWDATVPAAAGLLDAAATNGNGTH